MPPLQVDPNTGQTNTSSSGYYGGYDSSSNYGGQYHTSGNSSTQLSPYEQAILDAYKEGSGYQRDALSSQVKQAKDELDYKYASLKQQAKTSSEQLELDRWYKQEQTKLAQQAQALKEKEFQLSYADAETKYLSSPDTMFQARQLERSASSLVNGGSAYGSYRAGGDQEKANTKEDFARIYNGGSFQTNGGSGGSSGSSMSTNSTSGGGAGSTSSLYATSADTGGSVGSGQQSTSSTGGNDMDRADSAGSQLLANGGGSLGLGQYESLLPGTRAALTSLAKTKGIYMPDWQAQWKRTRPGQGSTMAA